MDNYDEIKTSLGPVRVLATDAKHIYVSSLNTRFIEGFMENGVIVVNSVRYYLSAHIYKWEADGQWHWGPKLDQQWSEPHMRRNEPTGNGDYNPSHAAREKAREVILSAVKNWIEANPEKLHAAKIDDLKKKLAKAEKENEELTKQVVAKLEEIGDLRGAIAEAEYQLKVA